MILRDHPRHTLFPYTTLFRSGPGIESEVFIESKGWMRNNQSQLIYVPAKVPLKLAFEAPYEDQLVSHIEEDEITRSEEHTSELQSLTNLVCRLLLEKKKKHRV